MVTEKHSPAIFISLAIDPPTFPTILDHEDLPILTVTVTSHAGRPITIFTWATMFNLGLAQQRSDFTCVDLTTSNQLRMQTTKGPQRYEYDRTKGSPDDKYFITLEPRTPITFSQRFSLAHHTRGLAEGHRYRFAISTGQHLHAWWYGRREDVMASRSISEWLRIIRKRRSLLQPSGEPIELSAAPDEFEVLHHKAIRE